MQDDIVQFTKRMLAAFDAQQETLQKNTQLLDNVKNGWLEANGRKRREFLALLIKMQEDISLIEIVVLQLERNFPKN
jgi:hypothetical protein